MVIYGLDWSNHTDHINTSTHIVAACEIYRNFETKSSSVVIITSNSQLARSTCEQDENSDNDEEEEDTNLSKVVHYK